MKRHLFLLCAVAIIALATGDALADSINGRVGITGRMGVFLPAGGEQVGSGIIIDTDASFIGGGGFIYGITDHWAAELDVTHTEFATDVAGRHGDFSTTIITIGPQFRLVELPVPHLVPYVAAGLDILISDVSVGDVDTVPGAHLTAGVDYFYLKELAFTGEIKGVLAPDADVTNANGQKIADFDPSGVAVTVGIRYFFN